MEGSKAGELSAATDASDSTGKDGPGGTAPGGAAERPTPTGVYIGLAATGVFAVGAGVVGALALGKKCEFDDANNGGDVSNAYNDGPVEPGKPSLGGFYELESSSPAAALAPGKSLVHVHETYHFTGTRGALETIAVKVLGVSLADVESGKL